MGPVQGRGVAVYTRAGTFIRNTVDVLSYSEIIQETIFVNNNRRWSDKKETL